MISNLFLVYGEDNKKCFGSASLLALPRRDCLEQAFRPDRRPNRGLAGFWKEVHQDMGEVFNIPSFFPVFPLLMFSLVA